ncbi:MAG: hypothetical protein EP321_00985 [Sphingomonadales bacterium]|nr:MAG: hypothetical protein EP345_16730 [Sphingomonadales bacterium]TNF06166.1 MAG: hypothetical protein EP321_00985 [Sphingomonadales bacterium]
MAIRQPLPNRKPSPQSTGCWRGWRSAADGGPLIFHPYGSFNPGGKEARTVRLMNLWGTEHRLRRSSGVDLRPCADV